MDHHIVQALQEAGIRDIAVSIRPRLPEHLVAAKGNAIAKLPGASLSFYDARSHPLAMLVF
jgi:hypothetical protein